MCPRKPDTCPLFRQLCKGIYNQRRTVVRYTLAGSAANAGGYPGGAGKYLPRKSANYTPLGIPQKSRMPVPVSRGPLGALLTASPDSSDNGRERPDVGCRPTSRKAGGGSEANRSGMSEAENRTAPDLRRKTYTRDGNPADPPGVRPPLSPGRLAPEDPPQVFGLRPAVGPGPRPGWDGRPVRFLPEVQVNSRDVERRCKGAFLFRLKPTAYCARLL
jgi:hypothetical protein